MQFGAACFLFQENTASVDQPMSKLTSKHHFALKQFLKSNLLTFLCCLQTF